MTLRLRRTEQGFTLIEVVFAFAIFALSAVALYEAFATASTRQVRASDREQEVLMAQSVLANIRGSAPPWEPEQSGSWGTQGYWQTVVRGYLPAGTDATRWAAYEVTVTVRARPTAGSGVTLRSIEFAPPRH